MASKLFPVEARTLSHKKSNVIVPSAAEGKKQVELYTPEFYGLCAVGGALSCGLTHTVITPLDLVKCNMQANPKEYTGIIQGFGQLFKSGQSIWKGWGPTLIGYSIQGLAKFGFYELFKHEYGKIVGEETAHKYRSLVYLAASASAEFIADVGLCPFEAVKVRVQTQPDFGCRGAIDGIPRILKNEGIAGLYKGLIPLWARQVPYTIIKFVAFERVVEAIYGFLPKEKHEYNKTQQLGVTFLAGYIAGVICGVVSHPADTMVSKLNKAGAGTTVGSIYKEIGFKGLWRGLGARVIMIGTLTGLQWFIYDSFKVYVGLPTTGGAPAPKKKEQE